MPAPRKALRRYEVPGTARFLTFSCYHRLPLFGNDRIKDRFVEHLLRVTRKPGIDVFAWVVMPEHIHLVLMLERMTVETVLRSLKGPFASEVLAVWRQLRAPILTKIDGFWQRGGGYDRNVFGTELLEKIDYCHNNPVKRGLCETCTDWKWSSARTYESRANAIGPKITNKLDRPPT